MIAEKEGRYSKIGMTTDGRVVRYFSSDHRQVAMMAENIAEPYSSFSELLADGWSILPPDLEEASVGETVRGKDGGKWKIFIAQGGGKGRCYLLTSNFVLSASQLKEQNFSLIPFDTGVKPETIKEMTVADISKALGYTVKVVK